VRGQWAFGGVERETGRMFLVAVQDRTAETLMAVVKEWILPGYHSSDCWVMYRALEDEGYSHDNESFNTVHESRNRLTQTLLKPGGIMYKPPLILITESVTICTTWQATCIEGNVRMKVWTYSTNVC
jgi:hypothetical protein